MTASRRPAELSRRVAAVRRFNRLYTRQIGVLPKGYLGSPFSLAEVRVLFELAHRQTTTAAELTRQLALDPGYLSRILLGLRKRALIARKKSPDDARQTLLSLTGKGRSAFAVLDRRAHQQIADLLSRLSDAD